MIQLQRWAAVKVRTRVGVVSGFIMTTVETTLLFQVFISGLNCVVYRELCGANPCVLHFCSGFIDVVIKFIVRQYEGF